MPRIKIAPRKTENSDDPDWKTKIVISPQNAFWPAIGSADIVSLRHPRTGAKFLYTFSPDNKEVFEVLQFNCNNSSWFVNDTVIEDGILTLFAPYDPVFHVLPYLMKCKKENKLMPLEDALIDEDFVETRRILQCDGLKFINSIAVKKGSDDLHVWAYDEEKTLKWLQLKIEKVVNGWSDLDFESTDLKNITGEEAKLNAFKAVSEWICPELVSKLQKYLQIPESASMKRPVPESPINETSTSVITKNNSTKENPAKKRKIAAPLSSSGNKISNYFTKK